jgi:hypothetical protein
MNFSSRTFRLAAGCVLAAGMLATTSPAFAAKGGGSGGGKGGGGSSSSTMALVLVSSAYNDGYPHYDDTITWKVSTTATDKPYVSVSCSQNGSVVYTTQAGYYDGYAWPWTQNMTLASNAWTGGAADCSARLYSASNSGSTTTLATTTFHVYS